ncbi:hypothetical protein VE03_01433 [Pseudogymnoascus sp. 23342-1-I1]|nr:hypothetical protein VE03_01433 [Pseudogymnoascus sp. 23342-1-I1]
MGLIWQMVDDARPPTKVYERTNPRADALHQILPNFPAESRRRLITAISPISISTLATMIGDNPPPAAKKTRARKPKVKSGCKTCKLRGVKCDEAKPVCRRCISTGRICDGYGIWGGGGNAYGSVSRITNPSRPPRPTSLIATSCMPPSPTSTRTLPPLRGAITQHEQRAFEYFAHRTSHKLPGIFDSPFWSSLVFQASTRDPAVLHALIALGAVDLGKATRELACAAERVKGYERVALVQYNKAIASLGVHFKSRDRDATRVALITCMLFICIELLRERFKTANTHLSNGLKLLSEIRWGEGEEAKRGNELLINTELESVDDYLVEAFTRFNIHSSLFGQDTIIHYTIASRPSHAAHAIPHTFTTFRIARLYLDALINAIYNLAHQTASLPPTPPLLKHFTHTQSTLRSSLATWLQTFQTSLPTLTARQPLIAPFVAPFLRTYHTMSTIILATSLHPRDELIYDAHTAAFESMIRLIRGVWETILSYHAPLGDQMPDPPGFTADMGFIPLLFFVVLKCRFGRIRGEALELLGGAPHREGLWDGVMAGGVGRRVVEIEEGGGRPGDEKRMEEVEVPGWARVYDVRVVLRDAWEGKAELRYRRCGEGGVEEVESAEVEFEFGSISSGRLGKCMFTGR